MDVCRDGWRDGWMQGWVNGWMDGWMDWWMNRRTDGWMVNGWLLDCVRLPIKLPALMHSSLHINFSRLPYKKCIHL